ncbi:MAG: hypothetical protein ACI87E_004293 [Mariniblastus sp.]
MSDVVNEKDDAPSLGRSSVAISADSVMRIKNLEMRAKIVVEGFMAGLHRSPYHGFSVEFTDYRQYSVGDDLRYLDWKLYARRDRYYIKRFEDETNQRCYLLLDMSKSMQFGERGGPSSSGEPETFSKLEYAKTMAATLAWFLNQQRDAVGLVTFGDRIVDLLPPRYRAGHLRRLMIMLENSTSGNSTDLAAPLEQIAQTVSKRGLVVLISDLLVPVEQFEKNLSYLRSRGHEVVILRVLDPAEVDFDFDQASLFHDLETGREIYVDPTNAAADYRSRFAEHEQAIKKSCDQLGIEFFQIRTDQPLETALFDLIQTRARGGKHAKRATQVASSLAGDES